MRYLDINDACFMLASGHPGDTPAAVLAAAWKLEKPRNVGDLLKLLKFSDAKRRPNKKK